MRGVCISLTLTPCSKRLVTMRYSAFECQLENWMQWRRPGAVRCISWGAEASWVSSCHPPPMCTHRLEKSSQGCGRASITLGADAVGGKFCVVLGHLWPRGTWTWLQSAAPACIYKASEGCSQCRRRQILPSSADQSLCGVKSSWLVLRQCAGSWRMFLYMLKCTTQQSSASAWRALWALQHLLITASTSIRLYLLETQGHIDSSDICQPGCAAPACGKGAWSTVLIKGC